MGIFLNEKQLESFEKDGLLVVHDFLTKDEVSFMRSSIMKRVTEMDANQHKGVFSTTGHHQVQ